MTSSSSYNLHLRESSGFELPCGVAKVEPYLHGPQTPCGCLETAQNLKFATFVLNIISGEEVLRRSYDCGQGWLVPCPLRYKVSSLTGVEVNDRGTGYQPPRRPGPRSRQISTAGRFLQSRAGS